MNLTAIPVRTPQRQSQNTSRTSLVGYTAGAAAVLLFLSRAAASGNSVRNAKAIGRTIWLLCFMDVLKKEYVVGLLVANSMEQLRVITCTLRP